MLFLSARDLFNSSGNENKIALRDNISLEMNDDYIINIISSIGDVKREFRLDDILRHNSSVQPLHYSGVRREKYSKYFLKYRNISAHTGAGHLAAD